MKGFKEFLFQGNVIELAVALVIGTAFAKFVDSFVSAIVTPILNAFSGGKNSAGLGFHIKSGQANTLVNFSTIINSLIVFVLTALVVYLLFVLPYKKYQQMRGIDTTAGPTDNELLTEIRDSLRGRA